MPILAFIQEESGLICDIEAAEIGIYDVYMDMNEAVAKAIGAERGIANLTVRELARRSGIPERSLMRILQAETDIKVNQVAVLANVLKLYPHELIEHAELILERSRRNGPDLSRAEPDTSPLASVQRLDDRRASPDDTEQN